MSGPAAVRVHVEERARAGLPLQAVPEDVVELVEVPVVAVHDQQVPVGAKSAGPGCRARPPRSSVPASSLRRGSGRTGSRSCQDGSRRRSRRSTGIARRPSAACRPRRRKGSRRSARCRQTRRRRSRDACPGTHRRNRCSPPSPDRPAPTKCRDSTSSSPGRGARGRARARWPRGCRRRQREPPPVRPDEGSSASWESLVGVPGKDAPKERGLQALGSNPLSRGHSGARARDAIAPFSLRVINGGRRRPERLGSSRRRPARRRRRSRRSLRPEVPPAPG